MGGPASPATAAVDKCGDVKKAKNVTADGTSCKEAKRVAKDWVELCSYAGRCVIDLSRAQYTCRGKGSDPVKIVCKETDTDARVKFEADI
jgi:hypothetical protein